MQHIFLVSGEQQIIRSRSVVASNNDRRDSSISDRAGPKIFGAQGETINCVLLIIQIFFILHFLLQNIHL